MSPDTSSHDAALVARANTGDREALEALYLEHRDFVLRLAWRLTGGRDDALDILQETFLELYARFPGFSLASTLRAFLYPVVKHMAIDRARRQRRLASL